MNTIILARDANTGKPIYFQMEKYDINISVDDDIVSLSKHDLVDCIVIQCQSGGE